MKQIAFALLLAGCSQNLKWQRHDHPLGKYLFEDGAEDRALIWRSGAKRLFVQKNINNKKLVMVSFTPSSILNYELKDHSAVVMESTDAHGQRLALVAPTDDGHLNSLAALAHGSDGFGCGRLQVLDPEFALAQSDEEAQPSPVYSEVAAYSAVEDLIAYASKDQILASIESFVALGTRFHSTTSGLGLHTTIQNLITAEIGAAAAAKWEFEAVTHKNAQQKSLIVRQRGQVDDATVIIVGAHMDSIKGARTNPDQSIAPGADDDASGMSTIIEVMRILSLSNATFARQVEFHFYAAEEVGLVGSGEIAASYRTSGRKVGAMLQLDMNAYSKDPNSSTIYFPTNDTSASLRRSLKDLLNTYLDGDYAEGTLTDGTSDHKSWTNQGFAAVFPFEHPTAYNGSIHTANDTTTNTNNLNLSERFAKLVLAYLSHHAGLTAIASEAGENSAAGSTQLEGDIKLAATTSSSGSVDLAAAAPTTVSAIQVCPVASFDAFSCDEAAVSMTTGVVRGSRQLFSVAFPFELVSGMYLRFVGYDQNDKAVQQRIVQILK